MFIYFIFYISVIRYVFTSVKLSDCGRFTAMSQSYLGKIWPLAGLD